jgi:2,3-dihydroxybiphenyl 1,2-dioxygenase
LSAPVQLAYLGFEVRDLEAWRVFADKVLGLSVHEREGDVVLRMDGRAMRIQLSPGERDDLAFVGWEYATEAHLEQAVQRLRGQGTRVTLDPALADQRGVHSLAALVDAGGIPTELVVGPATSTEPPQLRYAGGFVAGELGLGHVVLSCPSRDEGESFYRAMGFGLTDRIVTTIGAYDIDLAFMNVNPRHHSLALGGPQAGRLHHVMLQLADFDDLGRALHRARRAGCLVTTLGRHPNDRMVSFYVRTPSGFQVEVGWGGLVLDDHWVPRTHDRIAEWGHHHLEPM